MVAAQSALRLRYDNLRCKTCLKTNHLTFNRERGEQQPITSCMCVRNCNISERFQLLKLNTIIFILQHVSWRETLFQLIYPPVIFKIYSLRLEIRIYSYKRINYSNTWSNTFELLYCNFFVQFFISNKNLKYYYQSVCSSLRRSFWFQIKIIKKMLDSIPKTIQQICLQQET